jgi:hypothetical protein
MPINYDRNYVISAMYGTNAARPIVEADKSIKGSIWACMRALWDYFTIYD